MLPLESTHALMSMIASMVTSGRISMTISAPSSLGLCSAPGHSQTMRLRWRLLVQSGSTSSLLQRRRMTRTPSSMTCCPSISLLIRSLLIARRVLPAISTSMIGAVMIWGGFFITISALLSPTGTGLTRTSRNCQSIPTSRSTLRTSNLKGGGESPFPFHLQLKQENDMRTFGTEKNYAVWERVIVRHAVEQKLSI